MSPPARRLAASALVSLATAALVATLLGAFAGGASGGVPAPEPPPADAKFDYQIGGDYKPPRGVEVVSRDWFSGDPLPAPAYSVCYVNAFQTQANERGTDRPDERSNWPRRLVLSRLGDDPKWGGEYLIDIRSAEKRAQATEWVRQMIEGCAKKGYEGVEFDNLDSWTRFNGTPLAGRVPFGKREALDYAKRLAMITHELGMASGQKNTADISREQSAEVGFDFAVAEECGRYGECGRYRRVHGDDVIAIEYRREDFRKTCRTVGDEISVVLRDRNVSRPSGRDYVYRAC
ncbi:endo alpha-1,4 polygalactosaminidase [Thermoleophilia bacterium SCSIO 60948]|nr:endo alpha-1,4 polygalactosaminidase [Thermoleophilia bacterium SCSIO 60948]